MQAYNEFLRKVARITSDIEFLIPYGFVVVVGDDTVTDEDDLNHNCLTDLVYYALRNEEEIYAYIDYDFMINIKFEKVMQRMIQIGAMFDVYDGDKYFFSFYDSDYNPLDVDVIKPNEEGYDHYTYNTSDFFEFLRNSVNEHNVIIRINNNNPFYLN